MTTHMVCPLGSFWELDHALGALTQAKVNRAHVTWTVHQPEREEQTEPRTNTHSPVSAVGDGVAAAIASGAFGLYAAGLSMIFPTRGLLQAIGPSSIVLGALVVGGIVGLALSLITGSSRKNPRTRLSIDHDHSPILLLVHPETTQECEIAHQALTSAGHTHLIETA